jgi:hypothetical protein
MYGIHISSMYARSCNLNIICMSICSSTSPASGTLFCRFFKIFAVTLSPYFDVNSVTTAVCKKCLILSTLSILRSLINIKKPL